MGYDVNNYRSRLKEFKKYCDEMLLKGNTVGELPGLATQYTSIPIIVSAHLVKELYGSTPELEKHIIAIMTFYGYDKIEGVSDEI